jgi:hypothetical protein
MPTIINTFEKRTGDSNTDTVDPDRKKSIFFIHLKKYLLFPIEAGLYGFYLVFTVVLLLKLVTYILGFHEAFQFDLIDFMLSLIGFFLMFLVDILKNLHHHK